MSLWCLPACLSQFWLCLHVILPYLETTASFITQSTYLHSLCCEALYIKLSFHKHHRVNHPFKQQYCLMLAPRVNHKRRKNVKKIYCLHTCLFYPLDHLSPIDHLGCSCFAIGNLLLQLTWSYFLHYTRNYHPLQSLGISSRGAAP